MYEGVRFFKKSQDTRLFFILKSMWSCSVSNWLMYCNPHRSHQYKLFGSSGCHLKRQESYEVINSVLTVGSNFRQNPLSGPSLETRPRYSFVKMSTNLPSLTGISPWLIWPNDLEHCNCSTPKAISEAHWADLNGLWLLFHPHLHLHFPKQRLVRCTFLLWMLRFLS